MIRLFICCLTVVFPVLLTQVLAQDEASTILLIDAHYLASDLPNPPQDDAAWRPVVMPDAASLSEVAADAKGWYRFPIDAPVDKNVKQAVYLWRYGMNAAVYLNDHLLGDGGPIDNDRIRNTHRPLMFVLPPGSYRADQNYVYVQLKGVGGFARLMPPAFGDHDTLRERYDWRVFMQQSLPMVLLVVVVLVGMLSFIYSLGDSTNRGYRFLSLACIAWLPYSLNPIIHEVPISMDFWRWSMHFGIDSFGVSLVFFAHRFVGIHRPKLEAGLVAILVLVGVLYAAWSDETFGLYATRTHLLTVLLGCYTSLILFLDYRQSKDLSKLVFMAGNLLFLPLALHDILFSSLPLEQTWTYSFLATNLGAPALFLALGADLTWAVYRSNTRLREALELERSALAERSRIYRDVHDDVGARLLSLIYNAENEQQEQTARCALDDMRAAIKNNTQPVELPTFISEWRAEVMARCEEAKLTVDWSADVSGNMLNAESRYQLTKILRELLSNILRHSRARQLKVRSRTVAIEDKLQITLEDDGIGFDPERQSTGTGLSSIRLRLNRIDGTVDWSMNGNMVTLTVPTS